MNPVNPVSPKATRQSFGEVLARLGEEHPEIVVLDADLSKSTKSELFSKKYPDRFFQMGISEMNMIGTAAGLSFLGKIPFACSFGCFLTGRYDTIRLSVAYANANVKLIGTHAGVGIGDDGHSQMGLEDVTLMRALPGMTVFQPADHEETESVMNVMVKEIKGPVYLRLTRQNMPALSSQLPSGESQLAPLKDPRKLRVILDATSKTFVLIVASGGALPNALKAALEVRDQGTPVVFLNAICLKPFDETTFVRYAKLASHVLSVEDHSVVGGLGTVLSESLSSHGLGVKLTKIGVQDLFGESGEPAELYEKHGLSVAKIKSQILR